MLTAEQIVERAKNITNEQLNALCDIEMNVLASELKNSETITIWENDPHWGKVGRIIPGRGSVLALKTVIEKLLSNENLPERQYP